MQKQQQILLIVGVILALAAVFLVKVYIDQQKMQLAERAKAEIEKMKENQTSVLVAAKDIPKGSVIDAQSLEAKIIPNQYLQPKAVTSLDRISGMVTSADISKGEQITLTKLMSTQETRGIGGSLAMVTPAGKRAVTIPIDNITAVGGMVRPGDYVDIITLVPVPMQNAQGKQEIQTTTMPLFQNILVLAINQDLGAPAPEAGRYDDESAKRQSSTSAQMVTLSLSPQEANFIAFLLEQGGKMRLVLRSPADSKVDAIPPANWDTLFRYAMPQAFQVSEGQEAGEDVKVQEVEIYRGLNKEVIRLSGKMQMPMPSAIKTSIKEDAAEEPGLEEQY